MDYRLKIENEQLRQALDPFLRSHRTTEERRTAVEAALSGEGGKVWRDELAKWTVQVVPVEPWCSKRTLNGVRWFGTR